MKIALFILMLPVVCFGQHPLLTGAGIDWTRASPVVVPANFLETLPGAEHVWTFVDIATNTSVGVNVWTDRVQQTVFFWYTADSRPTNSSNGLVFSGSHAMSNNLVNATGALSSMSTDDTVNDRLFCYIYSTTNTSNQNIQSRNGGLTEGPVLSASGTGDNTGNAVLTSASTFNTQNTLVGAGHLKTDGTLQDLEWGCTNHPANGLCGANGYTNGFFDTGFAPPAASVQMALNFIGEGFHLAKINYWVVATYTNVNVANTASNVHYFRTNYLQVAH